MPCRSPLFWFRGSTRSSCSRCAAATRSRGVPGRSSRSWWPSRCGGPVTSCFPAFPPDRWPG
ncbi:MAG: hypothetical protein DMG07_19820 [Acidobacteria bacterium]|nr:MAG: hypothetical protein DMG07_19820 [Acidobacteriota bacterium]